MAPDIAPGSDGFNGCFLKSCWHISKHDFYQLFFDFYEGKLDLESLNTGYILSYLRYSHQGWQMIIGPSRC